MKGELPPVGHQLSIAMQKGGVGKTTTAINLSAGLAMGDYRTLLVDLDPQGNATSGLNVNPQTIAPTLSDVLTDQNHIKEACHETDIGHLDILPSSPELHSTRAILSRNGSEYDQLKTHLEPIKRDYDWIVFDCPPSLGPLTLNALKASDRLLIPLQTEYYALEGLSQLWQTVRRIQQKFNPELRLSGILMTMYDGRTNLANDVKKEIQNHFKEAVMETIIPRNVKISEAPGFGKPVLTYDPTCRGSRSYLAAVQEVLQREQQRTRERA